MERVVNLHIEKLPEGVYLAHRMIFRDWLHRRGLLLRWLRLPGMWPEN
jgi:hypothetical protein